MKNIRIFYLEIFPFLVVKFSIYLNRHVFVMYDKFNGCTYIIVCEKRISARVHLLHVRPQCIKGRSKV